MNQQDAAVNLQDVLDSLSRGIPAAIREEISLRAMGMALGQFLSSTHKSNDYDAIIEAMSNNNRRWPQSINGRRPLWITSGRPH